MWAEIIFMGFWLIILRIEQIINNWYSTKLNAGLTLGVLETGLYSVETLRKGMAKHSSILSWERMDRGAWQATVHGVTESDTTEQLTLYFTFGVWQVQCLKYSFQNTLNIYSWMVTKLYITMKINGLSVKSKQTKKTMPLL